ncbi:hypothetical protein [Candidatus Similichlamydia epinepheli]|uniref:hypothetical protein n=1 Tax=Candidatus Similichlamydia epinepheli TaxID=1903953 RepID=UPI001300640D|nr:hypothetical protein [Candidatus Similichlamydia epinepheli]
MKWSPKQIFSRLLSLSAYANFSLGSLFPIGRVSLMVLCLWRELYPLFLFQSLWGIVYGRNRSGSANHGLYGAMFTTGAIGLVVGSLLSSSLASFDNPPVFFLVSSAILLFLRTQQNSSSQITSLIKQSTLSSTEEDEVTSMSQIPGLLWMAITIILLQIFSCLQEFLLYHTIETHVSEELLRTKCFSNISFSIGICSIFGPQLVSCICKKLDYRSFHVLLFLILGCMLWGKKVFGDLKGEILIFCLVRVFDTSSFVPNRERFYSTLAKKKRLTITTFFNIVLNRGSKAILGLLLFVLSSLFDKSTIISLAHVVSFSGLSLLLALHLIWLWSDTCNLKKKQSEQESAISSQDPFP